MIGALIKAYLETHPITATIPEEKIAAAVAAYLKAHPIELPDIEGGKPSNAPAWAVLTYLARVSAGLT